MVTVGALVLSILYEEKAEAGTIQSDKSSPYCTDFTSSSSHQNQEIVDLLRFMLKTLSY